MGYDVEALKVWATPYPEEPEAPQREDYETEEGYAGACNEYEQDLSGYAEECEEIRTQNEAGEIALYLRIENNDIVLCYVKSAPAVTTATNGIAQSQELSPIEKWGTENHYPKGLSA